VLAVVDAAVAGKNGQARLGTTASTDQMLKLGAVLCVAMLVLGIVASGSEYRHRTIIPAMLVAPRRGTQVVAKTIALAIGGGVISGLTFGLGLATIVIELSAHGLHQLPPGTARLFADSVIAATLFGLIGVALGYITRSTIAAVVEAPSDSRSPRGDDHRPKTTPDSHQQAPCGNRRRGLRRGTGLAGWRI
jgi:ABC-2 type transport system permease protein